MDAIPPSNFARAGGNAASLSLDPCSRLLAFARAVAAPSEVVVEVDVCKTLAKLARFPLDKDVNVASNVAVSTAGARAASWIKKF